jgi:hypothetical protein
MSTETKPAPTVCVFRKWRHGGIIALFPLLPHDVNGIYSVSYERIGQHGAADAEGLVGITDPAKPEECTDLKAELERIGYSLDVRKQIPRNAAVRRSKAAQR